jgi:hypothetical protein
MHITFGDAEISSVGVFEGLPRFKDGRITTGSDEQDDSLELVKASLLLKYLI